MEMRGYQSYQKQTINTMTQGELLLMLYDELVKRLVRCDLALEKSDWAELNASANRAMAILNYLDDTLDHQYPISRDLHRLYDFFLYELNQVKIGRNRKELSKIRPMIGELRDAFRTADKNTAGGK